MKREGKIEVRQPSCQCADLMALSGELKDRTEGERDELIKSNGPEAGDNKADETFSERERTLIMMALSISPSIALANGGV